MKLEVLSLLKSKNRCLERYLTLSLDFWEQAEDGDLGGLAEFEGRRDETLKAIELFDRKIAEVASQIRADDRTPSLAEEVRKSLERKEGLIQQILHVDLKIIGKIEEAKSDLLKQMNDARKSKSAISKFKSSWVAESGEELDKKL